jgi:hypothetical protein
LFTIARIRAARGVMLLLSERALHSTVAICRNSEAD